ncbi:MAG: gliding motility-associated C-terminal domain-containing protein [Saprospiraceae bacterium]|nr:gliding motility-associated C-terminal domain-containing protein [Lewinellaceae bacterium]
MKLLALTGLVVVLVVSNSSAQCPTLGQNATFTSTDCLPGSNPCALCPGDSYTLNATGSNLTAGDCINWYISDQPNFNPYNGEGTLLGCSALTTPPPDPCNPNPIFLGIFVNACGTEENNEFMAMWSGGGFNLSDLTATYEDPANNGCSWQVPSGAVQSSITSECPGAVFVGAGDDVPANVPLVIFGSNQADFDYNFSGLCSVYGTFYVTQSDCAPATELFPNTGNGTVTTNLSIGCWSDDITYDLSQISNVNGAFVAELPILGTIYGQGGCAWPSFPGLPGGSPIIEIEPLTVMVDADECNMGPYYIVGIYEPLPSGCPETMTNYLSYDVNCPTPVLSTDDICASVNNYDLTQLQDPLVPDGSWLGPGVTGNLFDASGLSGPIDLMFTPTSPCGTAATTTVNILESPVATIDPVMPVCAGGSTLLTINFSGNPLWDFDLFANGVFQNSLSTGDNPFDVQVSPLSNTAYTIQNLTDINGCPGEDVSVFVMVSGSTTDAVLTLVGNDTICAGSSTLFWVDFTGGVAPYDFEYALNGVVQAPQLDITQDPYIFPITITDSTVVTLVSVTDDNGCNGTVSGSALVETLPAPSAMLESDTVFICEGFSDTLTVSLSGMAPFTFVYSINGVNQPPIMTDSSNYQIVVTPSSDTTNYTLVSVQDTICQGLVSGQYQIILTQAPTGTLSGVDSICTGEFANLIFNLSGGGPYTIEYTANGVPQTPIQTITSPFVQQVNPSVTTTYEITSLVTPGCPGIVSDSVEIYVQPTPTAVISGGGQICQGGSGTDVIITFTGVGPYTFIYSANNVNQPEITTTQNPYVLHVNPAAGVAYRLTSFNDALCDGTFSGIAQVFVFVPASATMSGSAVFCDSAKTDILIDFNGSGPFTIEYTIDGVLQPPIFTSDDPYFLPVMTDTTVTYELVTVESPGCTGIPVGSATITVNYAPTYENFDIVCDPAQFEYTVSFDIIGGTPPYTLVNGSGTFTGDQFTSAPINQANGYFIEFHDDSDCGNIVISGQSTCNCTTDAGTMDLTPIELCIGETAMAGYNGGFINDGNDLQMFILHTTPGIPVGNILAWNSAPNFTFQAGMTAGTTYYISSISGNDDGFGQVDLSDICLSVSQGTPVVFFDFPTADIGISNPKVCLGDSLTVLVNFTGSPDFSFIPQLGMTAQAPISGIAGNQYAYVVYPTQDTTLSILSVSDSFCANGNTFGMVDINVTTPPSFGPVTTNCDYVNETYTISFPVTGTPVFNLEGILAGFNGIEFTSLPIAFGTPYLAYLTDADSCGVDTLSGIGVCACLSDAGVMSQVQVNACSSDTITVPSTMAPVIDPGDQLMYILHTNPGLPIGTILGWNTTPSFGFMAGMIPGTIYYISAIVGNPDGMGMIDLNDPCLSVADGTPVMWYPSPTATLTTGTFHICPGGAQALIVSLTGTPNYTLTYTSNATMFTVMPTQNLFSINAQLQQSATITLTGVTDANGCTGTVSGMAFVNVHQPPLVVNLDHDCDFANMTYTLDFDVTNGDLSTTVITGLTGIFDTMSGHFTSNPISTSQPYDFTVSDSWGCGTFTAADTIDCSCVTDAGAMTNENLVLCAGDVATTGLVTGANLEPGDTLFYYLVDSPSPSTWNILDTNSVPSFMFNSTTMTYETTYYIVALAGNNIFGNLDLNDPCLSSAQGPTVVWRTPVTATISGMDTICFGNSAELQVSFTGNGPFFFTYSDGGINQVVSNIAQNPYTLSVTPATTSTYTLQGITGAGTCLGTVGGNAIVQVNPIPMAINLTESCDLSTETYVVSFDISNGTAPNPVYSAIGLAGDLIDTTFTSFSVPGAQAYSVIITDDIGCSTTVSGMPNCVCTSIAGTLSNIQDACLPGGLVSGQSNGNSDLDTNDVVRYILCTDPAILPAGIITESNTPQFGFQAGMTAETTYYIVVAVGNALPNGSLDFADPCRAFSVGHPVVFHDVPTASITGSSSVCLGDDASFIIHFTGNAPFTYIYSLNGVAQASQVSNVDSVVIDLTNIQTNQLITLVSAEDAFCDALASGQATINILPSPTASLSALPTICLGDSTALTLSLSGANTFDVTISGGATPIVINNAQDGNTVFVTPTASTSYFISNLVASGNNCSSIIGGGVTINTDEVTANATLSDYTGFNISCPNGNDGSIEINPLTGLSPYAALWSDGVQGIVRTDLPEGTYQLTLSDQIGCTLVQDFSLTAPMELGLQLDPVSPLCFGQSNGLITLSGISGGAGTFSLLLNGNPIGLVDTLPFIIPNLASGTYTIGIEDSNGCISDDTTQVTAPVPLMLNIGRDTVIEFGDSLFLQAIHNAVQIDTFYWSPQTYLSSPDLLGAWSSPLNSISYQMYLRDAIGCEVLDNISILVRKSHRVYIPNIIYPLSVNSNNIFTVYGGAEVASVRYMRIFDRWGELVYENNDFQAGETNEGWDGTFKGQFVDPAVFVYLVEIEYIDGTTELFKGDITVIR